MQYKWIYNKKLPCQILLPIIALSYMICFYIQNLLGLTDEISLFHFKFKFMIPNSKSS